MDYYLLAFDSFYELVWVFIIYAFLGWCAEVAWAALTTGTFINRGFLNGPVCPIYGVGIVVVAAMLTPLVDNFFILFIGSIILTTTIELVVGWGMEKIFHNQWWDYSMQPFNFHGYICLKFSLMWGFACVLVMDILHPMIRKLISYFPHIPGLIILIFSMAIFVADLIITINVVLNINRHIKVLDEIDERLDKLSESLGERIYENVTNAMEASDKIKENAELHREEMLKEHEELTLRYKELMAKENALAIRLMKAFPDMKSRNHNNALTKLKDHKGISISDFSGRFIKQ